MIRFLVPVLILLLSHVAWCQQEDAAREARDQANSLDQGQVFVPLSKQTLGSNAGMFVGVNQFSLDQGLNELDYAVHDAIELAHLFVFELQLIRPSECYLHLAGTPKNAIVQQHLDRLKRQGAQVKPATRVEILLNVIEVLSKPKRESDFIVCSFNSHGFEDRSEAYVMPTDGFRRLLSETAVKLQTIETNMEKSGAGHRLLLVDACQERISSRGSQQAGMPASEALIAALQRPSGQAKFASCSSGEFSFEHRSLGGVGHGVFTWAFLEALRGGAKSDDGQLVRLGSVADYVAPRVSKWVRDNVGPSADGPARQRPFLTSPVATRDLPLAARADDRSTLIEKLKQQRPVGDFTETMRDDLAAYLATIRDVTPKDRELLATTQDFVFGGLRANLFSAFVARDQKRWNSSVNPVPIQVAARFTVREADSNGDVLTGVDVEVHHQSVKYGKSVVLGKGTSDASGMVRLSLPLAAEQQQGGFFTAVVRREGLTKTWSLPQFPTQDHYRVYAPPVRSRAKVPPGSKPGEIHAFSDSPALQFAWCPAGSFMMGSPAGEDGREDDEGQTEVAIPEGFWMGRTEVTQAQWKSVMGAEPWKGQSYVFELAECPATYVRWEDAVEFCNRLSRRSGLNFRLPTEAEWEYACRAGTQTAYHFGDSADALSRYAWNSENAWDAGQQFAHQVAQKLPNNWGIFDMHGNVSEICEDLYADVLSSSVAAQTTGDSDRRVLRGGSWASLPVNCRSADRSKVRGAANHKMGFRVILEVQR